MLAGNDSGLHVRCWFKFCGHSRSPSVLKHYSMDRTVFTGKSSLRGGSLKRWAHRGSIHGGAERHWLRRSANSGLMSRYVTRALGSTLDVHSLKFMPYAFAKTGKNCPVFSLGGGEAM